MRRGYLSAEQHPGGVGGAGQAPAGVRVGVVPVGAGGVQDVQEPGGEVIDGSGAELPGVFGEERVDLAGAAGAVVIDRGQDPSGDPVQGFRCDVQVQLGRPARGPGRHPGPVGGRCRGRWPWPR